MVNQKEKPEQQRYYGIVSFFPEIPVYSYKRFNLFEIYIQTRSITVGKYQLCVCVWGGVI